MWLGEGVRFPHSPGLCDSLRLSSELWTWRANGKVKTRAHDFCHKFQALPAHNTCILEQRLSSLCKPLAVQLLFKEYTIHLYLLHVCYSTKPI